MKGGKVPAAVIEAAWEPSERKWFPRQVDVPTPALTTAKTDKLEARAPSAGSANSVSDFDLAMDLFKK